MFRSPEQTGQRLELLLQYDAAVTLGVKSAVEVVSPVWVPISVGSRDQDDELAFLGSLEPKA